MKPLMMVKWENGEGREVTSVGFLIHDDATVSGVIILAGTLEAANNNEKVTGCVQEIPITNVIKKSVLPPCEKTM